MKLTLLFSLITSITFSQVYNFGESTKRRGTYKHFEVVDGKISALTGNFKNQGKKVLVTMELDQANAKMKEIEEVNAGRDDYYLRKNNICYIENQAYFIIREIRPDEVKFYLREIGNGKKEITIFNEKIDGVRYAEMLKLDDKYILLIRTIDTEQKKTRLITYDQSFKKVNEVESDAWVIKDNLREIDGKIYFLSQFGGNSNEISIPRIDESEVEFITHEFKKDFTALNYSICQNKKGELILGCVGLTHDAKEPYSLKVFKVEGNDLFQIDEKTISANVYFADIDDKIKKEKLTYFTETSLEENHDLRDQKSELKTIQLSNGAHCFVFMENHYFGGTGSEMSLGSAEENENFIVFQIDQEGQIEDEKVLRHNVTSIGLNREIASFYLFEGGENEICILTNENGEMFDAKGNFLSKNDLGKSRYTNYAPFVSTVGTLITINDDIVKREVITSPESLLAPVLITELESGKILLYQFSNKSESFGIMSH